MNAVECVLMGRGENLVDELYCATFWKWNRFKTDCSSISLVRMKIWTGFCYEENNFAFKCCILIPYLISAISLSQSLTDLFNRSSFFPLLSSNRVLPHSWDRPIYWKIRFVTLWKPSYRIVNIFQLSAYIFNLLGDVGFVPTKNGYNKFV